MLQKTLSILLMIFLPSCTIYKKKSKDDIVPEEKKIGPPSGHVVMIIDDDIDPNHPLYADRVLATYTITCDTGEAPPEVEGKPFEQGKKETLAYYERITGLKYPDGCRVEKGIEFSPNEEINSLVSYRQAWNQGLREHTFQNSGINRETLNKIYSETNKYHGTGVTGVVAYKNPGVRFVLVRNLRIKSGSKKRHATNCVSQNYIDLLAKLYSDQDIIDAYSRVPNQLEAELEQIAIEHKVTLVNKSYSKDSAKVLTKIYEKNCGILNFETYVKAMKIFRENRDRVQKNSYADREAITFQSAGNDGMLVDDLSYECDNYEKHLLVGSYDHKMERSKFSNFGDCVDVYSLGENVITAGPMGFLTLTSGTSFAAPMTVRYISLKFDTQTSNIIPRLKQKLDYDKRIPSSDIPLEMAFSSRLRMQDKGLELAEEIQGDAYDMPNLEEINFMIKHPTFDPW